MGQTRDVIVGRVMFVRSSRPTSENTPSLAVPRRRLGQETSDLIRYQATGVARRTRWLAEEYSRGFREPRRWGGVVIQHRDGNDALAGCNGTHPRSCQRHTTCSCSGG